MIEGLDVGNVIISATRAVYPTYANREQSGRTKHSVAMHLNMWHDVTIKY